jgi:ribosome-binding factor A
MHSFFTQSRMLLRIQYFCHMETKRQEKINNLLQKDLGEIFQVEMRHVSKGAMITVTKVKVTPDLSLAKVYLSLFATSDKDGLLSGIRKHSKEIRGKLGNRIRNQLRVVPDLSFYLDDSLDYIENIENLLKD